MILPADFATGKKHKLLSVCSNIYYSWWFFTNPFEVHIRKNWIISPGKGKITSPSPQNS